MTPSAQVADGRRVRRWTRDTIIEKIREWNDRYGEPPCSADWNPSLARWRAQEWRAERYREGFWPSTNAAKRPFGGSFDAAVRAAGLEPHRPGPRRRAAGVARPDFEQRAPQAPRTRRRRADSRRPTAWPRPRRASPLLERRLPRGGAAGRAGRGPDRRGAPACAPRERARGPCPPGAGPRAGRGAAHARAVRREASRSSSPTARRASVPLSDQAEAAARDAFDARRAQRACRVASGRRGGSAPRRRSGSVAAARAELASAGHRRGVEGGRHGRGARRRGRAPRA